MDERLSNSTPIIMLNLEELEQLIILKSRRLYHRKAQQAYFGISADPSILMEIEDLELEIQDLQTQLKARKRPARLTYDSNISRVKIILEDNLDESERLEAMIDSIAGILRIGRGQISIINSGTENIIEIPKKDADRLIEMHIANEHRLHDLGIQELRITHLNFGQSQWSGYGMRGGTIPDNIVIIPKDELQVFDIWHPSNHQYVGVLDAKPTIESILGRPAVVMNEPGTTFINEELYLLILWIEERREWILIIKQTWTEGGGLDDENYSSPYSLPDRGSTKILEAYNIRVTDIPLNIVKIISPKKLIELSKELQV